MRTRLSFIVAGWAMLAAPACDNTTDTSTEPTEPAESGSLSGAELFSAVGDGNKADEGAITPIKTSLDASHVDLSVGQLGPTEPLTRARLPEVAKMFHLTVPAGKTVAMVARAADEKVDPYISVHIRHESSTIEASTHATLPMATDRDAMYVHTAKVDQELLVLVGGEQFRSAGTFRVDFISLEGPVYGNWNVTNAALRANVNRLREVEEDRFAFVDAGLIEEAENGLMVTGPEEKRLPMQDRARIRRFLGRINDLREALFGDIAKTDPDPATAATHVDEIALACARIWSALR